MRRFVLCSLMAAITAFGIAVTSVEAIAQDNPLRGNVSTAPVALTEAQAWKTIEIGGRKGVRAYRDALDAGAVRIGDSANEILGRPAFRYADVRENVELVVRSVAELGLEGDGATLADIYGRARRIGLALCPAEVGPQLRLAYVDQPLGEVLHIAMEPVATYAGELTILALANGGTGPLLIGSDGRPDFLLPRTLRFVFALPQAGQAQVRRQDGEATEVLSPP
jgi:hypothetical protein